ncbi:MAG: CoA transferase [Candidatus Tectomicrobia bacterium]|uniref:CoA transferase n=1 Tax=Tectimicrobiota bacterium TaxID=2528274 RepID=A0A933EAP1_UNCTE|nr:CoA transferase [Candidatus Tectomicrobia bacterium]
MLEGYRIIETGQVIAGTGGGMILADMGAEVIKVEAPGGDLGRNPSIAGLGPISSIFLTFNRGKKSVVLDLKKPEGKEAFLGLAARADAVIANFRPGTMDRLGLGFAALKEVNPGIVFVDSSGYGERGPWRDRPAFDLVLQGISGHMSITGEPGRPPVRHGVPTADITTALYTALACMGGLLGRARGGGAAHLEVPMFDVQLAMFGYISTMYLNKGDLPEPPGSAHEYMVPYQAFATKTIYIVLSPREERFWKKTCEVMGIPELADDPRYKTNDLRSENRAGLLPLLEDILRSRPGEEWLDLFEKAGVPSAPVNTLDRALENEQVEAREMIRTYEYPGLGPVRMVGNPILDRVAGRNPDLRPAPLLGEDTEAVLKDVLGYSEARIASLLASGAAKACQPAAARA